MLRATSFAGIALGALIASSGAAGAANWTRCHLGGFVGASAAVTELASTYQESYDGAVFYRESETLDGLGAEGPQIGVAGGCDIQQGQFVAGGFADYVFQQLELEQSSVGVAYGEAWSDRNRVSLDNQWAVGGRAGVLVNPHTLAYGLLAYTQAETSGALDHGRSPTLSGWQAGGGLETLLTPNIALAGEYRYTTFDSEHLGGEMWSDGPYTGAGRAEAETEQHTARAVIKYRFGGVVDEGPRAESRADSGSSPVLRGSIK